MAKAKKPDLRDKMWETPPKTRVDTGPGTIENVEGNDPDLLRPGFKPQADGQTSHQ